MVVIEVKWRKNKENQWFWKGKMKIKKWMWEMKRLGGKAENVPP